MQKRRVYNQLKLAGHILFWLLSITLMLFFFYYNEQRVHLDLEVLSKAFITNSGFALGVYINLYVLIPRFLTRKNYIFYIFWLIVLLSVCSLYIQLLFIYPLRDLFTFGDNFTTFDTNLHAAYFFATLIYIAFTSFLRFVKDWISLQDLNLKIARIEQQKLQAELTTLKGQLNPHFLFNSLNNIYSLALSQSEKVPDLILQLSDLMRHVIYESRENYIPIEKEIEFVNNFIALQKIRTPEDVKIDYQITGTVPSARIAPLIFEPFIDNAFKYGFPGTGNPDFISVYFNFEEPGKVYFYVSNNFEENIQWDKKNSGIGIANVKQRLKHLYNKSEYNMDISKENQIFTVSLQLNLK